jgi:SAM-dependent methyltransferase
VLHQDRSRAESFGADAERYDRARPTYPDEMINSVLDLPDGPDRHLDVLDVGCGTGIAARQFQIKGCRVLGVEIDERMAAVAQDHGIEVEVSGFEDWEPAGRSFDVVISGQAWHWVDPRRGAIKAANVLRPGGRLALFWNVGRPEPPASEIFDDVYGSLEPELDEYSILLGHASSDRFAVAAEGIRGTGRFSAPSTRSYGWSRLYTQEQWLDQLPTHSDHRMLPPERLHRLMTAVGEAIDAEGGSFVMEYDTVVVTAVLQVEAQ